MPGIKSSLSHHSRAETLKTEEEPSWDVPIPLSPRSSRRILRFPKTSRLPWWLFGVLVSVCRALPSLPRVGFQPFPLLWQDFGGHRGILGTRGFWGHTGIFWGHTGIFWGRTQAELVSPALQEAQSDRGQPQTSKPSPSRGSATPRKFGIIPTLPIQYPPPA